MQAAYTFGFPKNGGAKLPTDPGVSKAISGDFGTGEWIHQEAERPRGGFALCKARPRPSTTSPKSTDSGHIDSDGRQSYLDDTCPTVGIAPD